MGETGKSIHATNCSRAGQAVTLWPGGPHPACELWVARSARPPGPRLILSDHRAREAGSLVHFTPKLTSLFTDSPFSTPESNTGSHFQLYFPALGFCYRSTRHPPYATPPHPGSAPGASVNLPSTGPAVRGQNHAAGRTAPSVLHSTAHGTQAWPYLTSSYVSPRSGLNGLPVLSHWEATADTAKAATHCKQHTGREQSPPGRDRGCREQLAPGMPASGFTI